MPSLTLYSRQGCHLCEDFEQELLRFQQAYSQKSPHNPPFDVEIRDVDARPEWRAAYNDRVPLLLAGSEEISRYFLDLERLRRYLGWD